MRLPYPVKMLLGLCLVAGSLGLVTVGPSVELLVWTLAPVVTLISLWVGICLVMTRFPDLAKARAEDAQRYRCEAARRQEDLELEAAAHARQEAHERSQGRVSLPAAPAEAHGDLSLADRGSLSDPDDVSVSASAPRGS